MGQRNKTREDSNTIEHIYIIHPSSSPIYLLEEHGVFEKKKRKRKKKFDLHAPRGPSFLRVCDDKEGNDRLSWPRFNTSVYEEKVRARNAKSRANFSILHSQTPPSADRFVPTSMIESWRSIFEMDFSFDGMDLI